MHNERKKKGILPDEPPCYECEDKLMPENEDAMRIFYKVRHQLILGPGSAFDIRHDAIWRLIDEYQIQDRVGCFEKVCTLAGQWWIPRMNAKSED